MKFIKTKTKTVKTKKAKKAVKNPLKKGTVQMAKHKKKHHKKRSNPVKVKTVSKKRYNPFMKVKKHHKKRSNPAKFSAKGLMPIVKDVALGVVGLIVVSKAFSLIPIKQEWKNYAKIGGGIALAAFVKHPIAKLAGITLAIIGAKDAAAEKFPILVSGDDDYFIAGDEDLMDGDELISGTNQLLGAELMGANALLQGDYSSNDYSTETGMY